MRDSHFYQLHSKCSGKWLICYARYFPFWFVMRMKLVHVGPEFTALDSIVMFLLFSLRLSFVNSKQATLAP